MEDYKDVCRLWAGDLCIADKHAILQACYAVANLSDLKDNWPEAYRDCQVQFLPLCRLIILVLGLPSFKV